MTWPLLPRGARRLALSVALAVAALAAGCAGLPAAAPNPVDDVAAAAAPATTPPAAPAAPAAADPAPGAAPAVAAAAPLPRVRLDPELDAERSDLWQRVRDGYALTPIDDELVRKWEQFYAERPDYVQRMTERGGRYLFHIVEEVERRGMPSELALLPFIESAFNPQAVSHARASGMWQFMPATGKHFELRQNLFRDERRDVLASTNAALDYLQQLHTMFGDWHLALAAYNWGQGNVQRAIDRNRKAGLPVDYAGLRMPAETRNYVPKLQAVVNLIARPEAFGIALPPLDNHPYFMAVSIESDIDVALAAQLAGITLEEFQQLNPQHNKPVILAAGSPQVLLPYDNANRFVRRLARHEGPTATWTAWVAPKNVKPAEAARLVGISESRLREANRIPDRMLVKQGSTLLVPRSVHSETDVAEHIAHNAVLSLAPEARPYRRVVVKARHGDNVSSLARRHGVSVSEVAQWNQLGVRSALRAGQQVVLMLPVKPAKARATAPTGHRKAAKPAPRRTRQAAPR